MTPVYNTNLAIGETPEQRKKMLEGQGFSYSQVAQAAETEGRGEAQPTTSTAELHQSAGVMAKRPG